jgi:hypothetical protein
MADAAARERGGDMDASMNCKAFGKSRRGMPLRYAGMQVCRYAEANHKQNIKKEEGYAGI